PRNSRSGPATVNRSSPWYPSSTTSCAPTRPAAGWPGYRRRRSSRYPVPGTSGSGMPIRSWRRLPPLLLVGPYGDRRCLRRPGALLAFTFGVVGLFLARRRRGRGRWGRGRWGRRGRESRRGGHLSGLRRRLGSGTVLLGQAAGLGFGLPGRFRLVVCRRRVMVGGRRLLLGTDQFVLGLGGLLT